MKRLVFSLILLASANEAMIPNPPTHKTPMRTARLIFPLIPLASTTASEAMRPLPTAPTLQLQQPAPVKLRSWQWWTKEDDQQLMQLKKSHPGWTWKEIANQLGKTAKTCKEHYNAYLNAEGSAFTWTTEKENLLIEKHAEFGPKWVTISNFFPGSRPSALRDKYRSLKKRQSNKSVTQQELGTRSDVELGHDTPLLTVAQPFNLLHVDSLSDNQIPPLKVAGKTLSQEQCQSALPFEPFDDPFDIKSLINKR